MNSKTMSIAGHQVRFEHEFMNLEYHLWIDCYHNPNVCPECIQPGILSLIKKENKL